jgi:hypothetical protein
MCYMFLLENDLNFDLVLSAPKMGLVWCAAAGPPGSELSHNGRGVPEAWGHPQIIQVITLWLCQNSY